MSRRNSTGPYLVQILNVFAEGDWPIHQSLKSKKKAITLADTIAKSGEYVRVRWIDPTDGESITVYVADPNKYGWLHRHR